VLVVVSRKRRLMGCDAPGYDQQLLALVVACRSEKAKGRLTEPA